MANRRLQEVSLMLVAVAASSVVLSVRYGNPWWAVLSVGVTAAIFWWGRRR